MKIKLVCMGKTDSAEIKILLSYYQPRLPKFWNFEYIEIPDIKNAKNLTPEQLKKEEARSFLTHIIPGDTVILMDEKGAQKTSREFAQFIDQFQNSSARSLVFIIGGAYGFSGEMYGMAAQKISLSKMTFTHQMARLFIVEQIYRASQILQNKPYHND